MKDGSLKFYFGLITATLFCGLSVQAQAILPVLKTNARSLDVREGHNLYKHYWDVSPGVKKDVYFAHRFKKETTITFYSDIDSVSFRTVPGQVYNFIILLNNKDTCYTQISTTRESYYKNCIDCIILKDTIPFTVGNDNRVYITGTINNSQPLKFFFDNGADNTILFPSAFSKGVKLKFDDSVANRGTGGIQTRGVSNFNDVQIAKLHWRNEQVMYVEKQIGEGDGTIGYDVFEDKIIELDYEKGLMIIHNAPFKMDKGYTRLAMQLNGGEVPSVTCTLINRGKKYTAAFLFDMGATGCLFLNQGFLVKNSFYGTMKTIGEAKSTGAGSGAIKTSLAILPEFILGRHTFKDVPVNLESPAENDPGTGVLGMDILKRFNTILDYTNNVIYLRPNALANSPYKQPGKSKP